MRRMHVIWGAVLIVVVVILLARGAGAGPGQAAAPTPVNPDHVLAIGVVRVSDVFHKMQEYAKWKEGMEAENRKLAEEQARREQELKQMIQHLNSTFAPGSRQWSEERDKVDAKKIELQSWGARAKLDFERKEKQGLRDMHAHIAAASAKVALQDKLNLVIVDLSPELGPDLDQISLERLDALLGQRAVLYADKRADITEQVLMQADKDFADGNKLAGGH